MTRRTPIKHNVKTYTTKKGKTVKPYIRGKGYKSITKISTPKIKSLTQEEKLDKFLNEAYSKGYTNSDFNSYFYEEDGNPVLEELRKKYGVRWNTLKNHMEEEQ